VSDSQLDFTTFLASHGYISEVDAQRVREVVRNDSVPLGKVLVMTGMMGIKSVMAVLSAQTEDPKERFGAIAIRLGFITPEQLGEALRRQSEVRLHPAQVVLDLDLLDDARWREAMVAYCKFQESRVP
jgi:hypothetical protein